MEALKSIEIRCAACGRLVKNLSEEEFIKEYLRKMDVYLVICSERCRNHLKEGLRESEEEEKPYG